MDGVEYVCERERERWMEFDNEELHHLYSSSDMMAI